MFRTKRLPQAVLKRVAVHTRDGHTLEGVLLGVYSDAVSLAHVTYVRAEDQSRVVIEGDTLIPTSNLSFIQELAPHDPGADRA